MPSMELSPGSASAPSLHDLAIVGAWMLWPHNADARRHAIAVKAIDWTLASGRHPDPETVQERREYLSLVRDVPRPDQLRIERPFRDGMIAGAIVCRAIDQRDAGEPVSLGAIKASIAEGFNLDSPAAIDNRIWKRYRPVAPYWAAYLARGADGPVPCRLAELPAFLQLADEYRVKGEALSMPRSPGPVLRAGETIMPSVIPAATIH